MYAFNAWPGVDEAVGLALATFFVTCSMTICSALELWRSGRGWMAAAGALGLVASFFLVFAGETYAPAWWAWHIMMGTSVGLLVAALIGPYARPVGTRQVGRKTAVIIVAVIVAVFVGIAAVVMVTGAYMIGLSVVGAAAGAFLGSLTGFAVSKIGDGSGAAASP